MNRLILVFLTLFEDIIRNISGGLGRLIRFYYYKRRLCLLGSGAHIDTGVYLIGCRNIAIGANTHIDKGCYLASGVGSDLTKRHLLTKQIDFCEVGRNFIKIGESCHIVHGCKIYGYGGVQIGNFVTLSDGAKLYSLSNLPRSPVKPNNPISILPYDGVSPSVVGPIKLEDNCWLGIDVIVMPGVQIAKNSFVASNSIVMASFPENSHIKGNPAVRIKDRYNVSSVT